MLGVTAGQGEVGQQGRGQGGQVEGPGEQEGEARQGGEDAGG